jgi:hypothetical protein
MQKNPVRSRDLVLEIFLFISMLIILTVLLAKEDHMADLQVFQKNKGTTGIKSVAP